MSKKKSDDMLSWGKAVSVTLKMLRIVAEKSPKYYITAAVRTVWNALSPYVGVYISALIIEALSAGADRERIYSLVALALISGAVISIVSALLEKIVFTADAVMWYKNHAIYTDKMLDTDFVNADDPKTKALLAKITESQNSGGWGLNYIFNTYIGVIKNVTSLFGGVSLSVSLFLTPVPDSAGALTILNSPLMVVVFLALMIAITLIAPFLSTKANEYWAKGSDSLNLGNRLFSYFGFIGYDKSLAEEMRVYKVDEICDRWSRDKKSSAFSSEGEFARYARGPQGALLAGSAGISVIFTGFVYVFVCLKALGGAFGVGMITQYISAVTMLSAAVSGLIQVLGLMRVNAGFLLRIDEYLSLPDKMRSGSAHVPSAADGEYEIEFRDVSFTYPASEKPALSHVNIKFGRGERLAVVGQNGSGKTTFIKLLCRLYDPTEGVILLSGRDIREYDYDEYMKMFSVVFQDFTLTSFTLAENVASSGVYDAERVRDTLCRAGFGERLGTLKDGIDTYIYKDYSKSGEDISGGEAQKIAIARALYKNSPMIVLDEPTAALDPLAEAEIYEGFDGMVSGKTAVYISHRLSSCRFCGDIAVFDGGKLVERGAHEELLTAGGKYAELWHAQAQYYNE